MLQSRVLFHHRNRFIFFAQSHAEPGIYPGSPRPAPLVFFVNYALSDKQNKLFFYGKNNRKPLPIPKWVDWKRFRFSECRYRLHPQPHARLKTIFHRSARTAAAALPPFFCPPCGKERETGFAAILC
jgi:hypothetical protein